MVYILDDYLEKWKHTPGRIVVEMELSERMIFKLVFIIKLCFQLCFAYDLLGCKFVGSQRQQTYSHQKQTSISEVQFGKDEAEPYELGHKVYVNTIKKFKSTLSDYVSKHDFNTVDPMLAFFNAYNNSFNVQNNYKNFQYFFDKIFRPQFIEQGSLKQIIDMNTMLRRHFQWSTQNRFMATVWHNVDENTVNRIRNLTKVPDYFHHGHVALIFRFKHLNKMKYMIIDTEIGLTNAVIVEENEKDEAKTYSMLNNSQLKYITLKMKKDKRSLMYVGKPFCSYLQTTAKIRLLTKERRIIRRNNQGNVLASLAIDLLPEDGRSYFCFVIERVETQRPLLRNLESFMKTEFFQKFASFLNGFNGDSLTKTLNGYAEMIRHDFFLKLYRELLQKRPKSAPKPDPDFSQQKSTFFVLESSHQFGDEGNQLFDVLESLLLLSSQKSVQLSGPNSSIQVGKKRPGNQIGSGIETTLKKRKK